ncbi:uncharacterized protein LOC110372851 [Helicoverpa armigera]|uniref:uncharacterized protein LOC110372851 n=1 Tax=Helicoverpa armigera TaxID=29058 RepID=UPI00308390F6
MCFVFTCCGWIVDLVQRMWTFTMSCFISSAVGCVMLTSSMSGIALGYNYSLAEFMELKDTNVSVYLKRGVFDDEIADDMDWRRSGRKPVAGHIGENDLRTGAPADDDDASTLRSGRRLDDSIFESDQNSFEGALMKLTAKPPYQSTDPPLITEDMEMVEAATSHPSGSLDQMKAIQSLIDSRRAMAASIGTTFSPMATYAALDNRLPFLPVNNNPNEPGNPDAQYRRVMNPMHAVKPPNVNPARYAVPDANIASGYNWVIPKKPMLFPKSGLPDFYILSPTYPSAITVPPRLVRPGNPVTKVDEEEELKAEGPVMFATRTGPPPMAKTSQTSKPAILEKIEKESETFNERFLLEGDEPGKNDFAKLPNFGKSSEEEYEDEIKGLPVRKRRSVKDNFQNGDETLSREINTPFDNASEKSNRTKYFSKNIFTATAWITDNLINSNNNSLARNEIKNIVEDNAEIDNDTATASNTDQHTYNNGQHVSADFKKFLSRLIKSMENEKDPATETTPEADSVTVKMNVKIRRLPFESRIVSGNYEPNNEPIRMIDSEETLSNQEMLNSISVNLNEAGLLRDSASSTFVKLLQSSLT